MIVIFIIGIVVLYGALFTVENYFAGTQPTGEGGSSYATVTYGQRAWSELLTQNDIAVTRDRGSVSIPAFSSDTQFTTPSSMITLSRITASIVILGGTLPAKEGRDVEAFVRNGGRLITDNPDLLYRILGNRVTISPEGATRLYVANDGVEGLNGISQVTGSGVGSVDFDHDQNSGALLTDNSTETFTGSKKLASANAAILTLGRGDVIALVDTGVVSNAGIARQDNALFALRIAGSPGSSVVFGEGIHGFNDANGFAGMPLSWRIAIIGLFLAFVIFACAQGRRFGVGEEPDRTLNPRRVYFAYAIAHALKKTKNYSPESSNTNDKVSWNTNIRTENERNT